MFNLQNNEMAKQMCINSPTPMDTGIILTTMGEERELVNHSITPRKNLEI